MASCSRRHPRGSGKGKGPTRRFSLFFRRPRPGGEIVKFILCQFKILADSGEVRLVQTFAGHIDPYGQLSFTAWDGDIERGHGDTDGVVESQSRSRATVSS